MTPVTIASAEDVTVFTRLGTDAHGQTVMEPDVHLPGGLRSSSWAVAFRVTRGPYPLTIDLDEG